MTYAITNTEEFIQADDIIARLDELTTQDWGLDEAEQEELLALLPFAAECEANAYGWESNSETLIRCTSIDDYLQEMVQDTAEIPELLENYIDWDKWVEDCKVDYTEVTFDGVDYFLRNC